MGQVALTLLTVLLLYIRRFSKDFDNDQVSIFGGALVVVMVGVVFLVWLSNRNA